MTDSPQPPYFPTQPPPQVFAPAYYAPRPAFEGLTKRQKRAAAWAGAIGLNVMSFGGSVLVATALLTVLAVTFAGVSSSAEPSSGLQGFDEFITESQVPLWLVAAAAVGVVAVLLGMFLSAMILRAGRVRRPFAVTWSAFGITVPIITVLNFIGGFLAQIFFTATLFATFASAAGNERPDPTSVTTGIVVAVVVVVLSIVIVGVIGWLAWWWMAHAFRERIPVTPAGATSHRGRDTAGDSGYLGGIVGGADGGGQQTRADADGNPGPDSGGSGGRGGSGDSGGWGGDGGGSGGGGDGGGSGGGGGGGD